MGFAGSMHRDQACEKELPADGPKRARMLRFAAWNLARLADSSSGNGCKRLGGLSSSTEHSNIRKLLALAGIHSDRTNFRGMHIPPVPSAPRSPLLKSLAQRVP